MKTRIILLLILAIGAASHTVSGEELSFDDPRWVMQGGKPFHHMGRTCFAGYAYLKDVEFEDGIIEVDVALDGSRAFPGIFFRVQPGENYEHFYIRPHKINGFFSDALQYTPVINGVSGWQLYSGEGYTAAAVIPKDQWVHLKLEIQGTQARVFIEDLNRPALVIHELEHGKSRGSLGLSGSGGEGACFSNFRYTPGKSLKFDPPPEITPPPGVISEWELSQAFRAGEIDFELPLTEQGHDPVQWRKVKSKATGMMDLSRHVRRTGPGVDAVWAKSVIRIEKAESRKLLFGYSDYISVFLNGRLLFTGNSAYRSRSPGFAGIMGLNDTLYLPLEKGENELLLLVAESFGGWGFICRDGNAAFHHDRIALQWGSNREYRNPESVAYDAKREVLYVSNFYPGGRGFISRVKTDGEIETLKWIPGLNRPTGLCLKEDKLFAVERNCVVEIDIESAEILDKHKITGAGFLNDIALDGAGNAYISDSQKNLIYRLKEGRFEVWLDDREIQNPNGLCVDEDHLLVGCSGDASLKVVGIKDKKIRTLIRLDAGSIMDGVKADGQGSYLLSDYRGRMFLVSPTGKKTLLLDVSQRHFCADLEYIPEKGLIVIPTLEDRRLMAYRYAQ